ncbi:hypothetical protein [Curvibacter lanceolatus]|uniref:hypothetical protein n=1 Tax=Curvibacter lanceolatus TaxID=86182 RepID=UPI003CCC458E
MLLASLLALSAMAAVAPPGTVIPNIAAGMFSVDKMPLLSPSNEVYVQVPFDTDRIGVAKQASQPIVNLDATGSPDGTATVSFTLRVRNYGQDTLSKIELIDQIEGSGASQLGNYTSNAVPGGPQDRPRLEPAGPLHRQRHAQPHRNGHQHAVAAPADRLCLPTGRAGRVERHRPL